MRKDNQIQIRKIEPDAKYGSQWIAKLINKMMQEGKKSIARNIVYEAIEMSLDNLKCSLEDLITKIIQNVSPKSGTTKRKLGGTIYNVPVELDKRRSEQIGISFIVKAARARLKTTRSQDGKVMSMKKNRTIAEALFQVFVNTYNNVSSDAIGFLNEINKLVKDNAPFAHLANTSKSSRKQNLRSAAKNNNKEQNTTKDVSNETVGETLIVPSEEKENE